MSKTFHTVMTVVVHTTTTVDEIEGRTIRRNACHSVAPSIRAASSNSSGTDLIADERMTMQKPVCSQIRMTIRYRLFHGVRASTSVAPLPKEVMMPLIRPICSPKPSARKQ